MQARNDKASKEQIGRIWGLAKKLGLDSDALHEKTLAVTNEEHISRLTELQADKLIASLQGNRTTYRPDTRPASRVGQAQINMILGLSVKLGWPVAKENRQRLNGFLRERYSVEHIDWLDPEQARQCIEALKAMLAGNRGERKGHHVNGNDDT